MAILTVLTEADFDGVVSAYDLGPKGASEGIPAGTVNTSYSLVLGSLRYFLRLYEEQGTAGAEAEALLLQHLAGAGVCTPAPLPGRDGKGVRTVGGKPAALFPWVAGDMLCLASVTPDAARDVGGALARMHLAGPAPWPVPPLGSGRFGADDLVARCARIATATDAAARVQAEPLRDAIIRVDRKRRTDLPTGLVHGDLFRDNVLFRDGAISALLDFESAHLGPWIYDVAVLVLAWAYRDAFDFDVARAIVAGYREVRELSTEEVEGFYVEALFASLRFTVTRITDDAARVGKRWQRFAARRAALETLGPVGFKDALSL